MAEISDMRVELTDLGVIAVSGADARTFLGNLLTGDVRPVSASTGLFSAWCDAKGRALATFWLVFWKDVFYLILPKERLDSVMTGMSRYRLRSKVELTHVSDTLPVTGLAGDPARLCSGLGMEPFDSLYHCQGTDQGVFMSIPASGSTRGVYLGTLPECPGVQPAELNTWHWLDVMAGIPWITEPTVGAFIPQMLNLGSLGGLCFSKGCYPGQEVIARLHYRGQLKRQMFLATLEASTEVPRPGTPIYAEGLSESLGEVVQAARAPDGVVRLLAVIKLDEKDQVPAHLGDLTGPLIRFE